MDSFTSSPSSKRLNMGASRAKSSTGGSKRGGKSKDSKGRLDGESKRAKRAEMNKKVLFLEIKRLFDKAEEASSAPGASPEIPVVAGYPQSSLAECKSAIKDRRFLRFLCGAVTGNRAV